jgi:aminopeptidase N
MLDIQTAEPHATAAPVIIRREDYRAPDWLIPEIALDFQLDAERTIVTARLSVTRNGVHDRPLVLNGEALELLFVSVDGAELPRDQWPEGDAPLTVPLSGAAHVVETKVAISPAKNSQLMGLYASGGLLCTQCEAEGFRRITYFPDRPDVLSRYSVRLEADKVLYPVLLANGDPVESGNAETGRHWARWNDPFPKPCYLFALVAGDLACNADSFTTMSGRNVKLGIWVKQADLPRTEHAMKALKDSRWRGTSASMAANMISMCSTSSRSPISTSARWRTRGSTSSTAAISSPIPKPRPISIMTRSRAWWRTNISTTGPATASPAATGSSSA